MNLDCFLGLAGSDGAHRHTAVIKQISDLIGQQDRAETHNTMTNTNNYFLIGHERDVMLQEHGVAFSAGGGGLNSREEEKNWWTDALAAARAFSYRECSFVTSSRCNSA